jgi:uncharacterized protein (TIGR03437 family)
MMQSARFVLWFLASGGLWAEQYLISTYAGGAPPTPAPGLSMSIGGIQFVAADAAGNAYFPSINCVFKLDRNGVVTRVAGNSQGGYSGDGGPATSAQLNDPVSLAVDGVGNLFIVDRGNFRIRKVSTGGIITTVAGNGTQGFSGDGGPATSAQFDYTAFGVAVDGAGNLFISDNHRIRKVSTDGIITTVAGGGSCSTLIDYVCPGDGGPATSAALIVAAGVAVDQAGNQFIVDQNRIRKVSTDGIITTVAGNGIAGFSGDGGPAISAQFSYPVSVAVDGAGNLFIADRGPGRIRKVSSDGIITTVAGNGVPCGTYTGCLALGDGGPATNAQLGYPVSVAVEGAGNLFIADSFARRLREVSTGGIITTVAGNGTQSFSGDGGPATSAQLNGPTGVAVDRVGNLFIADNSNFRIREVSPGGIITTVAGNGTQSFSGDGGPATNAQLNGPYGVALDDAGDLFFSDVYDTSNYNSPDSPRVRKVLPNGTITTVAGNGSYGFSGDGGPATSAQLFYPAGVADGAGNLFIADSWNDRVRVVSADGTISTYVNLTPESPVSVTLDGAGNLFIADSRLIYKVTPSRIITTVAGNGTSGFSGDGGPATSAQLNGAQAVVVDQAGNLFIADSFNSRIRKVSPGGIMTTVAGNGISGFSGDGGPATSAQLNNPGALAVDGAGNVYVADTGNNAIRILRPTNHSVLIGAVVDAASQRVGPISPGKIVVIYGSGLGPAKPSQNQATNGQFGTSLGGTSVSFNGMAAPLLYASATQVAAIAPYAITGATAQVTVSYQGETSDASTVPVALSAPSLFTSNQTGAGQAAALNADGTANTASNPVKIGGSISLYATGEGQTAPAGVDGELGGSVPILPVKVTIGGIPAMVQFAGGAPRQVSGLMQVNVQIPNGVQPGGYVPVALQVGDASTAPGAVWIAVSGK